MMISGRGKSMSASTRFFSNICGSSLGLWSWKITRSGSKVVVVIIALESVCAEGGPALPSFFPVWLVAVPQLPLPPAGGGGEAAGDPAPPLPVVFFRATPAGCAADGVGVADLHGAASDVCVAEACTVTEAETSPVPEALGLLSEELVSAVLAVPPVPRAAAA